MLRPFLIPYNAPIKPHPHIINPCSLDLDKWINEPESESEEEPEDLFKDNLFGSAATHKSLYDDEEKPSKKKGKKGGKKGKGKKPKRTGLEDEEFVKNIEYDSDEMKEVWHIHVHVHVVLY